MSEPNNIGFKMLFDVVGTHVHCTFFVVTPGNVEHCGTLVVPRGPAFAALVNELPTTVLRSRKPNIGIAEASTEATP